LNLRDIICKVRFQWLRNLCIQNGKDENGDDGKSKSNRLEASLVVDLVDKFVRAGDVKSADIGVITPYKAQVDFSTVFLAFGIVVNKLLRRWGRRHKLLLSYC